MGGASLDDAPELEPGTTYNDTLRPREQLIYKVKVEHGQSPRMSARLETDTQADQLQSVVGLQVQAGAFNPIGQEARIDRHLGDRRPLRRSLQRC